MTALAEPRTREEMAARHREGRARMERAARRHAAEKAVPPFARQLGPQGPYEPAAILELTAWSLPGGRGDLGHDAAAAYWLLGLTALSPLGVSEALGLGEADAAIRLMRLHARMTGLPPINFKGET